MISFYGKRQVHGINWFTVTAYAFVPLSHNFTAILSAEKLKSQGCSALAPFEAMQPMNVPVCSTSGTEWTSRLVSGALNSRTSHHTRLLEFTKGIELGGKTAVTSISLSPFITSRWRP